MWLQKFPTLKIEVTIFENHLFIGFEIFNDVLKLPGGMEAPTA